MAQTFAAAVDDWTRETKARMDAVFRQAISYTFEDVVDRTPVDTGFLRSTWRASLSQPQRLKDPNPGGTGYQPEPYELIILGAEYGDTVYGTFSANYAQYVEYGARGRPGRGMVRLAAQNWQANVNRAVQAVRGS
jgi:hypothetical protein